jgi:divinyl protochlorophyllide a 8-vinyl-reductase
MSAIASVGTHVGTAAQIGPNAITQVAAALHGLLGEASVQQIFGAADLTRHLSSAPTRMVDEADVIRLHAALRRELGAAQSAIVAREAGRLTGEYLLANRIPRPAQAVLKRVPAVLASRMLLASIRGHSWTFAGSGVFTATGGRPTRMSIVDSPMCRGATSAEPLCDFYSGTFERLFRELVHRDVQVTELACGAQGAPACEFEANW